MKLNEIVSLNRGPNTYPIIELTPKSQEGEEIIAKSGNRYLNKSYQLLPGKIPSFQVQSVKNNHTFWVKGKGHDKNFDVEHIRK